MNIYTGALVCFLLSVVSCSSPNKQSASNQQGKGATETPGLKAEKSSEKIILFFGNSITAGYGLDIEESFPSGIENIIDSLGYPYQVVNAGLSGETTAGGLNRIEWVLQTVPDVFVLELGANDGLRGLDLKSTKENLIAIIRKVKEINPEVLVFVAGMEVPPNLGADYTGDFRKIFPEVAKETGSELIPFILDGVAGESELNQGDGIHPTAEGAIIVAKKVWSYLAPHLEKSSV